MNATQPPTQPTYAVKTSSQPARLGLPRLQRSHKPRAFEIVAMLVVNVLLSATAVSALIHLISYQNSQQAKLREIQSEVKSMTGRVRQAREKFNRNLDPQQARQIMQEQTNLIEPQQLQVVLVPAKSTTKSP